MLCLQSPVIRAAQVKRHPAVNVKDVASLRPVCSTVALVPLDTSIYLFSVFEGMALSLFTHDCRTAHPVYPIPSFSHHPTQPIHHPARRRGPTAGHRPLRSKAYDGRRPLVTIFKLIAPVVKWL
jgi:hypothetical protein